MSGSSSAGHYFGTEIGGKWWMLDGLELSSGLGFDDRPSADAFAAEIRSRHPG